MTVSPSDQLPADGVRDFTMPMVPLTFKVRIAWLKTLKSIAITRAAQGQPCDGVSELIREALALWADEKGIDLNGFF